MKALSFWEGLKELDRFFHERDEVHKTMRRAVRRLEKAGISYAIVGGMAVFAQGHRRATNDVDILLTSEGFEEFKKRFVPKKYRLAPGRPRRFVDQVNEVTIDILVAGMFPGSGKPGPIAYPDPAEGGQLYDKIRVADLPTLIRLKLAARRHQDFADVVNLIRVHRLDESYTQHLHSTLRRDFIECLEEARREEEYVSRDT
jgi:hypothetical protein